VATSIVAAHTLSDNSELSEHVVAKPLYTPQPEYPESERAAAAAAQVVVHHEVDERGAVTRLRAEGPPAFRQTVVEAVATWRFQPAMTQGLPRKSKRVTRFQFRVES
jgi:TonB family protein